MYSIQYINRYVLCSVHAHTERMLLCSTISYILFISRSNSKANVHVFWATTAQQSHRKYFDMFFVVFFLVSREALRRCFRKPPPPAFGAQIDKGYKYYTRFVQSQEGCTSYMFKTVRYLVIAI